MSKNLIKIIFIVSLILNGAFALNAAKRYYYSHRHHDPTSLKIHAATGRQTIYELFPVDADDDVMVGNSHTQFYPADEFFPKLHIANRGIAGETSTDLLNRLDDVVTRKPRAIFIESGFNDFHHGMPASTTIQNIGRMIDLVKANSPRTKIHVFSLFPCDVVVQGTNPSKLIPAINAKLQQLCAAKGVTFINAYDQLADGRALNAKYDSGDGTHLNGKGYQLLSSILERYL